jgi:hypothetical protein
MGLKGRPKVRALRRSIARQGLPADEANKLLGKIEHMLADMRRTLIGGRQQ